MSLQIADLQAITLTLQFCHCRDGVIDKAELKALLQSTDGGRERVTKHKVSPC